MRCRLVLLTALMVVAGCGSPQSAGFAPPGAAGGDTGSDDAGSTGAGAKDASSGGTPPGDAARDVATPSEGGAGDAGALILTPADGGPGSGCPPEATLVYITGGGSALYSFYPPTLTFTLIGTMTCLPASGPTHMTVDRQGFAWVLSAGSLYKASTKDASCTPVTTWTPQSSFLDFALTFLGTTQSDTSLYILGNSIVSPFLQPAGAPLGRFDIATGTLTSVGLAPVTSAAGDMTTPGDGALYFAIPTTPATIFKIDPASAAVLKTLDAGAQGSTNQGFAFWGGSFYLFENGVINRFDPQAQTTTSLGMAPISVTGAGQSTCVPMVPPPPR